MKSNRVSGGALLQRAAEPTQRNTAGRLTDDGQDLAIGSEPKVRSLAAQPMQPSGELANQPLLGGEVLGLGPVHCVPDANSLIVGEHATLGLAVLQGTYAQVHLDAQFRG